jgi:hypothetical protein
MQGRVAVFVLTIGVFVVGAASAASADGASYPPTRCEFTVNRTSAQPGETLSVSGKWPSGGLDVTIAIDPGGAVIGRAITAADGTFTSRVTIPSTQPLGPTKLVAADHGRECVVTAALDISRAATASRTLAFTGSSDSTGTIVAIGALAVGLGSVLVVTARRSRRARTNVGS